MTADAMLIAFAGAMFFIVMGLVVFIFLSLQNKVVGFTTSFEEFRLMIDEKLTSLGTGLTAIDKDLRNEMFGLDRRTTILEVKMGKQEENK